MILTIDIGTTNCKAALFDEKGKMNHYDVIALDSQYYLQDGSLINPIAFSIALHSLITRLPEKESIEAVIVTGSGPSLIPVSSPVMVKDGLLTAKAFTARLYLDRRAVRESSEVSNVWNSFIDASFFLPKALYVAHHEKEVYEKTTTFLSSYDYINYLFTGEKVAIMHAPDAIKWYYNDEALDALHLDKEKFAPLILPGTIIGTISSIASRTFNLPKDIKVIAGGPDFLISILGSAAVFPGMVCDRSGTSEGINICSTVNVDDNRLMSYLHPIAPYYNISGIISTSGKAISWAKELVGVESTSYEEVYHHVDMIAPGSENLVFLPYLMGERAPIWDPLAKGVFSGLSLSTSKWHLMRSVIEGVTFALRDVIETIEDIGQEVTTLRSIGGGVHVDTLQQIKANITQKEVAVPYQKESEMVGAMALAMHSLGHYTSLQEACTSLISFSKVYYPDVSLASLYDDLFGHYRHLYASLKGSWA
ncbi:MAG: hypothetical protein EOM67_03475 [Spirochaetia bacterium]|nr:hypothetical protein [Spirochaetia bacterium]